MKCLSLDDGNRIIKLYTMTGFDHTDDMILVYLPKERLLAEAECIHGTSDIGDTADCAQDAV